MSRSNKSGLYKVGVNEDLYWEFVYVDHYISPILHNNINLINNVLYNLLDYGNKKRQ